MRTLEVMRHGKQVAEMYFVSIYRVRQAGFDSTVPPFAQ